MELALSAARNLTNISSGGEDVSRKGDSQAARDVYCQKMYLIAL